MGAVDFKEVKARKNGVVTPMFLAENLSHATKDGKIKKLLYFTVGDDDVIRCGWSEMTNTELIGLVEIGKQNILDHLKE